MKKLIVLLSSLATPFLLAEQPVNQPHTIGPVVIVSDFYSYHTTIRFSDGVEKEFYHCDMVGALTEGRRVNITFVGDGTSMENCARSVEVSPVHAKSK